MGIALWILFGLIIGSLARWTMPGPPAGGLAVAMFVGVLGGVIGGTIGSFAPHAPAIGFDVRSLLMAMIGTLGLLFSYRCFAMRAAE